MVQLKQDVAALSYQQQVVQLKPPPGFGTAAAIVQRAQKGGSTKETSAPALDVKPGMFGMVTTAVSMKTKSGDTIDLNAGDAVEVVKEAGEELEVKAWSGHGGDKGRIPTASFKPQPRISNKEDTNRPEDYVYKEFKGELFLGKKGAKSGKRKGKAAPRLEDVLQGSLGDCYLLASMGAVVAQRPDIIQNMVVWDDGKKLYAVTFQELQDDGSFKPHVEFVDSFLPAGIGSKYPKYAMNDGKDWDPKDMALWPAIIEKAYAQWKGGYKAIEEEGGLAEEVMTEITGAESESVEIPTKEADIIALFIQLQKDQKPTCVGTRNYMKETNKTGLFSGSSEGPYEATLTTGEGLPAELVKGKLRVTDKGGVAGSAKDDKKGNMKGSQIQLGSVDYDGGQVELTYKKGKIPKKADDLKANYRYHGVLSSALNLHGEHYYIFREVKGGKIYLHNPWGPDASYQPKPMGGAEFLKYFDTIDVNTPAPASGTK